MVYRVYVEKRPELAYEADSLKNEIINLLQIEGLCELRLLNRYDVENINEALFDYCIGTVFSEPQLDITYRFPMWDGYTVFAVEYLPGQFDQRADSAAQCIQIISHGERPAVRTAKVYLLKGDLTSADLDKIKKHVINPVESRIASLEEFDTIKVQYELPTTVPIIDGFINMTDADLSALLDDYGLAMDFADISMCKEYFAKEQRDPTLTEIRMIDTYWSDHCRHTTFNTIIDEVKFEDELLQSAYNDYLNSRKELGRTKPVCLMDLGTIAAKCLKKAGKLQNLDESEEINACTVKITVNVDGKDEDWLLLFKNETHNHPTEIEPFGGAATCIGGAIRDPLSGRSYVYAAMRVTGAADPTVPISETLEGKLPQRKIVTSAAAGYSSYGNQIGLATGQVEEIYHPGYAAKRMEVGAVIAAAPAENVRRERPKPGDIVILLGGKTGRDGCGGATGSSKSHTLHSLESCGAEVQKGNAPEERKLQRLFRNPDVSRMILRCNDFGAGGVSVAIGELADGLEIDLNAVPKKYDGLDGTELAISESQERMAVVVEADNVNRFLDYAAKENLEATIVAKVTEEPRLVMHWNGNTIVNVTREFLDSNGAEKHVTVSPEKPGSFTKKIPADFYKGICELASDLNVCSKRGLSERFDSTIGSGSVLMPFGGKYQKTPIQAMVHKISVEKGHTDTCSIMSYGYNPFISEKSPYHGAYLAVVESAAKLVASGAEFKNVYLSFQEYFEKLKKDPDRWGKPFSALLGAYRAQMGLEIAAIGGKDSMSGTFEDIHVPPTLISFAVTTSNVKYILSPEFKGIGNEVIWVKPETDTYGLPTTQSLKSVFSYVTGLMRSGKVLSAYTPTYGGISEAVLKMSLGNRIGFKFDDGLQLDDLFAYNYGSFILEVSEHIEGALLLGFTTADKTLAFKNEIVSLDELDDLYENRLEKVFPCNIEQKTETIPKFSYDKGSAVIASEKFTKPRILIPVFPGTNCEYDSAKAARDAGLEPEIFVINNLSSSSIANSTVEFAEKVKKSQIIFIPGGFSGGDEPDGSGKFITAFFRNGVVKTAVQDLLQNHDGLMLGICNGFQALIKLGLVPYGDIIDTDENCPTLTFNTIGRHQSKLVRTRICSTKSPWLTSCSVGDIFTVPISHGEGRFLASLDLINGLAENGQIATQYVDLDGTPTYDVQYNPNNSVCAIEGILSPDGRVLGKMGHSERVGDSLYKNVPGNYNTGLFASAQKYYK